MVLWVVGEPGVGKTTFCRKLLATHGNASPMIGSWTPFGSTCVAVGRWNGGQFDGGDTVPPSKILPALADYRNFLDRKLALFDGDKFANVSAMKLVDSVHALKGIKFVLDSRNLCVHIVGPDSAAAGRAKRVAAGARPQNESWVRGRATKSARFAAKFEDFGDVITINRDKGETWEAL